MQKIISIFGLIGLSLMISVPVFSDSIQKPGQKTSATRIVLRIQNLSCNGCFGRIRETVSALEGFTDMKTSPRNRLTAITFTPPLTTNTVLEAINGIGYGTVLISATNAEIRSVNTIPKTSACSRSCCGQAPSSSQSPKTLESGPGEQPVCCRQSSGPDTLPTTIRLGQQVSEGCCASIATWKHLINTLITPSPDTGDSEPPDRKTP